jgi:TonB family protein
MKKSAFLLLLLLFNISLFAQNEESGMPIFPTCDTTVSQEEAKMCTEQKLLKYINNNLVYPSISRESGVEGLVVVRYIVTAKGEIMNVEVIKGIGGGCDEEAIRIIESMNKNLGKWTPAKTNGKPISIRFNLPIRFKLPQDNMPKVSTLNGEPIYSIVEKAPSLLQCDNKTIETKQKICTEQRVIEYILEHFQFPEKAINKRIKGIENIELVVTKSGKITSIAVKGGLGLDCRDELIRVIKTMDDNDSIEWMPAQQNGKIVHAKYSLNIDLSIIKELKKAKRKELKAAGKN